MSSTNIMRDESKQETTVTNASEIIIREVTVLTNDESKVLPSDLKKEEKPDSYSSEEEEEENIKQNDNNDNQTSQENQNTTDIDNNNNNNTNIINNDNNCNDDNNGIVVNDSIDDNKNEAESNNNNSNDNKSDTEITNNIKNDDDNANAQEEEEERKDDDKEQIPTSTFLTETDETHLLKATEIPNSSGNNDNTANFTQAQSIDPAEIEAALNALLDKNTLPPPEYTDSVIQLINHKRMDCLEESDYRGAENLDSVLDQLIKKNTEQSHQKSLDDHEQKFTDRLNSIKDQISDINTRYDTKIQTMQNNFEEKYQQLADAQEQQLRQFKEKWQNPDFLKQFDRPSKNLLSMRSYEKKMALSGRYNEARTAKLQADRAQQHEEREMQKQIESIMKSEFLKLRNQQQLEVNKMASRNDILLEEVEMQRKKELEPLNTAMKTLDNKKKSNLAKNIKSKSVTIAVPKIHQNSPSASQKTPRTAQRVIKYKNNCQTDFTIPPIDDQQFQRLASMSTRQKARAKSSLAKKSLPPL